MEKIVIKKASVVLNREESTMVRIDKTLHERLKGISEATGYSVQYIVNFMLMEAEKRIEIVE